jgi:hypothetical protein
MHMALHDAWRAAVAVDAAPPARRRAAIVTSRMTFDISKYQNSFYM